MKTKGRARWYVLIHQIPPKPLYLRAKIRQRLARVGAVALKSSVYLLPRKDACLEDLQWIAQEAVAGGAEAYICEADFVEEQVHEELVRQFRQERGADYELLASELRDLSTDLARRRGRHPEPEEMRTRLARARKRLAEITEIDFFETPGRKQVEELIDTVERRLRQAGEPAPQANPRVSDLGGRTWVTRKGLHVDRIASAWLIRRFIDSKARFRFVDPKTEPTDPRSLRFDMVGGDFSHEGDRCTFETLLARIGRREAALSAVAEIVHDIDLKDGKFGRPEARGIEQLITGVVLSHPKDEDRLRRGLALFDDLYESFRKRTGAFADVAPQTKSRRQKGEKR
jgi:hypothetical protein